MIVTDSHNVHYCKNCLPMYVAMYVLNTHMSHLPQSTIMADLNALTTIMSLLLILRNKSHS